MAVLLWWPLSPWLSPAAAWFIFFNAVVGAIALMSCTASEHQPDSRLSAPSRRRLGRSGSSMVLDRLRSFSIFSVHHAAAGVTGALMDDDDNASAAASTGSQFYRYGTREAEEAVAAKVLESVQPERGPREVPATTAAAPPAAPVAVAPAEEVHAPPAAPVAVAPAEEVHAPPAPAPPENQEPKAEAEEQDESISMDEAYALAQRRRARAQELASPSPPPPSPPASTTSTATARAKKPAATVAEGVSRRRTKAKETLVEGKAELNARADLFIRQFREELKLQRLNSILGHAHALRSPTAAAR